MKFWDKHSICPITIALSEGKRTQIIRWGVREVTQLLSWSLSVVGRGGKKNVDFIQLYELYGPRQRIGVVVKFNILIFKDQFETMETQI